MTTRKHVREIAATGYVGDGAQFLADDGAWKIPAGGGGGGGGSGVLVATSLPPAGEAVDTLAVVRPALSSGDPAGYRAAVLADSPWGFWEFGETAFSNTLADSGSNATAFTRGPGIVVGKPALVADGGAAVAGSGSAEIASLATIPASLAGAAVTFEAWVDIPAGNYKGAFFCVGTVPSNGWGVGIGGTTMENTGRQLIVLQEAIAWKPTGHTFTTGLHHLVVTRSATNLFTVYVDGVSVWSQTFTPNAPSGKVWVGGGSNGATRALSAEITMDNAELFASELSAARVAAHYNGGAGDNAAVAADSPVVWLKLDDTGASSFADSSPNARHLAFVSGNPVIGTGPGDGFNGIEWPTDAYARTIATLAEPTTSTYEAWVYLDAAPGKDTPILVVAPTGGSSGHTSGLAVDSLGKVISYHYPGALYKTADALTFGVWHHVVTSTGAAGSKIRVDGVTVASSATTSDMSAATGVVWAHAYYNGSSIIGGGPVSLGAQAFWPSQLSDAATDAHFHALKPPPATAPELWFSNGAEWHQFA